MATQARATQRKAMGAVSFLHRFGSSLNPHYHYHLCVVDGLFEKVEGDTVQDPANPESRLRFHEATALTHELLESLQHTVRTRVIRHMVRHGLLEPHDAEDMLGWDHGGGFSLDAGVRIESHDRVGLERLIRYCARPPFALDRLHLVGGRSDQILYILPKPDPAGRTVLRLSALEWPPLTALPPLPLRRTPLRSGSHRARAHPTDPGPYRRAHLPPLIHPARGPPQTELARGPDGGQAQAEEVAQESFPDDLDQTPRLPQLRSGEPAGHPLGSQRIPRSAGFDPTDPEPIPEDDFDQSCGT